MALTSARRIAVIKVGGDVLLGEKERSGLVANIKDLLDGNWDLVLLHGGGPQVDQLQKLHGLATRKIAGRRITSKEDILVIKQAICGEVNITLCQALQDAGINAFACSGLSGKLIEAKHRPPRIYSGAGPLPINYGEVGDVSHINSGLILKLVSEGLLPVIASLGVATDSGRVYNINADTTAVKIAQALKADLLLLCTSVGAIYEDFKTKSNRVKKIDNRLANQLINRGVIQNGMIPKTQEALSVLSLGVNKVAIVGPQVKGAFLSLAEGRDDFGTSFSLD